MEIIGIETALESKFPAVFVKRTVFDRTDGIFPLVARCHIGPLHDAAARETQQTRMDIGKCLCNIGAQTVTAALESINREKAYVLKTHLLTTGEENTQLGAVDSTVGAKHHLIFLPIGRSYLNVLVSKLLVFGRCISIDKLHADFTFGMW